MKIIYPNDNYSADNELIATVGFFDGVHLGHRFLIDELVRVARSQKRLSAVFTFSEHPRKVLHSDFQPLLLTTFDEKITQLSGTGIDLCFVLNFTSEMSQLSAFDFLSSVLYKQFNVRALLVGHDHHFGHNRSESFTDYKLYGERIGIEVRQAVRFSLPDCSHISSSDIRKLLMNGAIEQANYLLKYNYSITGKVIIGFQNGRKIGFPTANILPSDSEKLIPATGVYAVEVCYKNVFYNGMLNIGNRPTLDNGDNRTIEVNIFDFEQDIYDQELTVVFIAKIRDEQKFNSLSELKLQLQVDKIEFLSIFKIKNQK